MATLRKLQQSFLKHLLGTRSDVVEYIQSTNDASAQQRLSIYANGYRLRLKEAITSDHDCLHGYLGDETFDRLLECYIDKYPSQHTSLRYYSQHITELLAQQEPFSAHPELVELAQIEQAFNDSFDAADCSTISAEKLAQLKPENWPDLRLQFHRSVQLLTCEYNSFQIWKALTEENTPPELEKEKTVWLIWRKGLISRYRALPDAEAHALFQVTQGANFSTLCESLLDHYDENETPKQAIILLQSWINEMMVCSISAQNTVKN